MSPRTRIAHRDPDILALVEAAGGLSDPKTLVINQARNLNRDYRTWDGGTSTPMERLKQLASLRGYTVSPMEAHHDNQRDAVVLMGTLPNSKGGQIFYNPLRPAGRVAFSIAHEIAHTFFPATNGGARFREMADEDTHEANELERLCHAGAAELLMPIEEFQTLVGAEWNISTVPRLASRFGASFEATVFRLATAHPNVAVAGAAYYRRTKSAEAKLDALKSSKQTSLFDLSLYTSSVEVEHPKYRRQSLHLSENCPKSLSIHWNKSFSEDSCVYTTKSQVAVEAVEALPVSRPFKGVLQAIDAPYQRSNADPDHPDVLFFWKAA